MKKGNSITQVNWSTTYKWATKNVLYIWPSQKGCKIKIYYNMV